MSDRANEWKRFAAIGAVALGFGIFMGCLHVGMLMLLNVGHG